MGFLDKMLKDMEQGVGRAQFEMDKQAKVATLRSEIDQLNRERRDLLADIGEEAVALYASREIRLPGLEMKVARLQQIRETIESKELELTAVQSVQFAAGRPPASPGAPVAARPAFCGQCGNKLPEKAAFCPQCGTKIT